LSATRGLKCRPEALYKSILGRVDSGVGSERAPANSLIEKDKVIMRISTFVSAIALGVLLSGSAFALDAAAPAPDAAARAAKSAECSKQADAKGLHGKDRKKFREECKKAK
jgi:psiF repeat